MRTLTLRISDELEDRLENLARATERTKESFVRQALEEFLEEREDYLLGIAVLERDEPSVTLEELERDLGLES